MYRLPTMLECDNVVHLMRLRSIVLMQQAVLTPLSSACNHYLPQCVWDVCTGHKQEECLGSAKKRLPIASTSFQDRQPFTELEIGVQLSSFARAQGFLAIFVEEIFQALLRRRRYLESHDLLRRGVLCEKVCDLTVQRSWQRMALLNSLHLSSFVPDQLTQQDWQG